MTGDDLAAILAAILKGLWQQVTWPRVAVLGVGSLLIFGRDLWRLAKGLMPTKVTPSVDPLVVPLEDASALELVQTLRVVTCLEPPSIRDGIAHHLDAIDSLLGGNPETDTDLDPEEVAP